FSSIVAGPSLTANPGADVRQISGRSFLAYSGQRGWNVQPGGGADGDGTSPSRMSRVRFLSGSISGTADRSATVYGCSGRAYSAAAGASSTTRPRYMTATRSHRC